METIEHCPESKKYSKYTREVPLFPYRCVWSSFGWSMRNVCPRLRPQGSSESSRLLPAESCAATTIITESSKRRRIV
jgi:hypothetical protein